MRGVRSGCVHFMYKIEQAIPIPRTRLERAEAACLNPQQPPPSTRATSAPAVPAHAVMAEVPRMFEESLWKRGLLSLPRGCTPVWFLIETERNVALWRRGFSLIAVDEFEFLVDVPALIEKRERQLSDADESNPFHLAPIAPGGVASEVWERERSYLRQFAELWATAQTHLAAMSGAAQLLMNDLTSEPKLAVIVLPDLSSRLTGAN